MAGAQTVITTINNVTVVSFASEKLLDPAEVESAGRELYVLVDQQAQRKIVVDFSQVKFLSSQMIGVILNLHKKSKAIKGEVVLCGLRPELRKVFQITNLDRLLTMVEDEEAALNKLGAGSY